MAEYIKREDVCYQLEKQESIDRQPRAIRRARRIVAEFPAADVVPVVRCRECKHWRRCISTDDRSVEYFNFSHCEKGHNGFPDFFCADGAKMEGDGE